MMFFWGQFDPRVSFVFVVFLAVAEAFVQIRWRLNLVCKHCGFDPALYIKNPEAAAQKVKAFLARKKEDPAFLLSPPLNLPKVPKKQAIEPPRPLTSERRLSKQV